MKSAVPRGLALGLIALCWLSDGVTPLRDACEGVATSADFARDYVTARMRLENGRHQPPVDGERANERAQSLGVPRVVLLGGPYYLHPPPALLAVLPLARLPWRWAAGTFAGLSLAALVWLARSLLTILTPGRRPRAHQLALMTAALTLWPPTLHCLEKGQWSIGLAALIAAGTRALEERRDGRAGALYGIAAALKVTPVALFGMLLARGRWRATAVMGMTLAIAALAALAVIGFPYYRAFVEGTPRNVLAWAPWVANTASLQGVFARLLQPGPFSRPLVIAPSVARTAFGLSGIGLLAAAVTVAIRLRRRRAWPPAKLIATATATTDQAVALWSAAWLMLPVLLNPLGWSHVVVMLLPSMAVAARDGGRLCRWAAVIALALLSVPRQRLLAWAGPIPVGPWAGLALGTHAFAAVGFYLIVLAVVLRASHASDPEGGGSARRRR